MTHTSLKTERRNTPSNRQETILSFKSMNPFANAIRIAFFIFVTFTLTVCSVFSSVDSLELGNAQSITLVDVMKGFIRGNRYY